jgi:hypothetical protein
MASANALLARRTIGTKKNLSVFSSQLTALSPIVRIGTLAESG